MRIVACGREGDAPDVAVAHVDAVDSALPALIDRLGLVAPVPHRRHRAGEVLDCAELSFTERVDSPWWKREFQLCQVVVDIPHPSQTHSNVHGKWGAIGDNQPIISQHRVNDIRGADGRSAHRRRGRHIIRYGCYRRNDEVFSPDAFVEGEDDQGCGGDRGDGSGIEGDVLEGLEVLDQGVGPLGGSPH